MDKTFNIFLVALILISCICISCGQLKQGIETDGPFASSPFDNQLGQNQQSTPTSDVDSTTTTTTPSPRYTACFNGCRTISNYNPVCGSDGVTYMNVHRLDCARQCGRTVTVVRGGTCVGL